jgi:hypothetical protein
LSTKNDFPSVELDSIIPYEDTSLSFTFTVDIIGAFFLSYASTNCSAADFSLSIMSSQNNTRNGSSQMKGFALNIASPSHLG